VLIVYFNGHRAKPLTGLTGVHRVCVHCFFLGQQVEGLGFRVQGLGVRVWVLGFRHIAKLCARTGLSESQRQHQL
jgi:hypothetical protein